MKLTKKLEAEVLKAYKAYWEAYFKGDMKTFASMLDDDITVFGTAVSEVFNNKKEALKFYKATAGQLVGKVQLRNRQISLQSVDENILINEQGDFYALLEGKWTYYGQARVSAILKQTKTGWKLIHQHASFPDTRADEGEQLAAEKIKEENLQLRDAVKRRTIELEEKNRELQIEAAVERVRAKALAMHQSEDIHEVVRTLRDELFGLNLEGVTAVTICLKQDDGRIRLWDITDLETTGRYSLDITFNIGEIDPKLWIRQIWSSKKKIVAFEQDSNDLKRTLKWVSEHDKKMAEELRELIRINKITHGWHRAVKLANGRLITDFINEPPAEIESILLKMGAAFDLAYKRFLDLQKAEAQAREAQIESGLERVRSRSLAMHNSSELQDVIHTVHKEFLKLNIAIHGGSFIAINRDVDTVLRCWGSGGTADTSEEVHVPLYEKPFYTNLINRIKNAPGFFTEEYTEIEKKDFFTFLLKHEPWSKLEAKEKKEILSRPGGYTRSCLVSQHTSIFIINQFGEKFSAADNDILQRFGKVFEQAYKRFLDLEKAEAQAKEARLEASLERVRSKTMAMHKSEEVTAVAVTLNEELIKLGFAGGSTIIIIDKETGNTEQWTGFSEDKTLQSCYVPYFKHPCHDAMLNAWKKRQKFFVYTLAGKEKKSFDQHYFKTGYKHFPERDKTWMRQMESVTFSHAFMKYGAIHWGPGQLREDQLGILQRFSKVFEQSYTRFLDLQKAETQAREAKIEAALERVRSRSMAMHKSDDLHEVIKVVTEQLTLLNVKFNVANFAKIDPDGSWDLWLSTPEQAYPALIHVPYLDHPIFNDISEQVARNNDFFTRVYNPEEANIFFHHFFENTIAKNTPEERKRYVYSAKGFTRSLFLTKNIWFSVSRYDLISFTDEENAIFKRFANVFEQAYTRFLDLQKAEAQAKEARIEASLERVRSRTMGMQKSEELKEVIQVVYEQFVHLGIHIEHTGFIIDYKTNDDMHIWLADQHQVPSRVTIPYFDCAHWNSFIEAKEKGLDFFSNHLSFEEKNRFYQDLFKLIPGVPDETSKYYLSCPGLAISTVLLENVGLYIENFLGIPYTDEENKTLMRFGKVFEQAYIRFNDLKQAEEQARESQIQLALERVRARTMAMQHSDELKEAVALLFQQAKSLGVPAYSCGYNIWEKNEKTFTSWMSTQDGSDFNAVPDIPLTEDANFIRFAESKKKGEQFFVLELRGERMRQHYQYLKTIPAFKAYFDYAVSVGFDLPETQIHHIANFSHGNLLFITLEPCPEFHDVFKRFAAVFEQTYTRFLDLQKAEAEAKEARIEASLERVRARAMAMQNSDELRDLIGTVFTELTKLDFILTRCLIMTYDPGSNDSVWWMANSEAPTEPIGLRVQNHGHPAYQAYVDAWKQRQLKWTYILEGNNKKDWDDFLFVATELSRLPGFVIEGMKAPDKVYLNASFNTFGNLTLATLEPLSDEHFDIMLRFAKVFDLTYTRFNDLKLAEAQTREAQIELGLERVRARAMAMQRSEELKDLVRTMSIELGKLDIELDRSFIVIYDLQTLGSTWWMSHPESPEPVGLFVKFHEHAPYLAHIDAWRERKIKWQYLLEGETKKTWDSFLFVETELSLLPEYVIANMRFNEKVYLSRSFNNFGYLTLATLNPLSDEQTDIMLRFARVFDLTYTRFNDLKQAEAQAKEARIQLALERVRARTMAMQKSNELAEAAKLLYEE